MTRSTRQSELTEAALKERALRLLATREHSRFELRRKLMRGTPSRSRLPRGRASNKRADSSASDGASGSSNSSSSSNSSLRISAWVDTVVNDLVRDDLLSDERFAESFVRRGIDRGHGPLKIRAGLRSRAVADGIIDDALTFSDDFWLDRARAAQTKRFGDDRSNDCSDCNSGGGTGEREAAHAPVNRSEWARRARFLAARGFGSDIIYRTLTRTS